MKSILILLMFVLIGTASANGDIRARTLEGRDVMLRSNGTWYFMSEQSSRRGISPAIFEVPLGRRYVVELAPWLLDEQILQQTLRLELVPSTGDITDLVLFGPAGAGDDTGPPLIRLRIDDGTIGAIGVAR